MTNISALIEQMQEPEFYSHPIAEPIKLVQTHVSYVVLTGEYAYKIKKAVNFGFLDFSSLEKRKHFCEEEIRMNRAIAPELYLEVVPITEIKPGKLVLEGDGEIVEYAVKMLQLPQENLLSELFSAGKLTEKHLEELGKTVADFHAVAITSDRITSFGEVEKIRESFDSNYQQTEKYIGIVQTKEQFDVTKKYTNNFFAEKKELFKQRRDNNKIKECHGDLHLRNIWWWQNKIRLFDRIEFNEPFRFVDVMYEIAFTVMDLDARGRSDFGNIFLNTYIEQTGDWEGLQVLPLYLSRQAYVRAKVTSFLLDDPNIPPEVKEDSKKIAADYYRLAWEYTKSKPGKLILMSGLSGSGKTTVAKKLAKNIGAILIRSDAVRKHIAGIALDEKGGDDLYSAEMNQKTYNRLLKLGIILAAIGFPVILDAKYDRTSLRQRAIDKAKSNGIPLQILHCSAPISVLKERLSQRTRDISDATPDLLDKQIAATEAFTTTEKNYLLEIDTSSEDWKSQLAIT